MSIRRPHSNGGGDLFERFIGNPILTASDWPYQVNSVFNPGAVRLQDTGETLLLCRVEDRRGISHLTVARSNDGVEGWVVDPGSRLMPDPDNHPAEIWGVEDPRIVYVEEEGRYAVTYTAYSSGGPGVALALTRDFKEYERLGVVMSPEDKDASIFPRRFGNHWAMLHRPVPCSGSADIWISFSPDLRHWGSHRMLIEARRGAWWDAYKIGLSTQPIETEAGWLMIYHGVKTTAAGSIYRVGLALLDLEDPTKCLLRGDEWVFGPSEMYEAVGDVPDAVFPCGATIADDGDTLRMYYGAADTVICLATARLSILLEWLRDHG